LIEQAEAERQKALDELKSTTGFPEGEEKKA
jgi:hypothetical protein